MTYYVGDSASLAFLLPPGTTLHSTAMIEMRGDTAGQGPDVLSAPKSFHFLSGILDMAGDGGVRNEFRVDSNGTLRFAGDDTVVRNACLWLNAHDNSIVFEDGVRCENVKVAFNPWGNADQWGNSLRIAGPGTDMGDFVLEGNNAFESEVEIVGNPHFDSFTFDRQRDIFSTMP